MNKHNKTLRNSLTISWAIAFICLISSCEIQENFEYEHSNSTGELGVNAWQFIQENESFNILEEAIKRTELQSIYENDNENTYILPSDDAFKEYLQSNAYASLEEVPIPILRNALKYHIVEGNVLFTDPSLSKSNEPLPYKTENGQTMYLSHNTNFEGLVNQGTNKQFTIISSNLVATNGVIHVVPSIVYFSAPTGDVDAVDPSVQTDTIFAKHDTYINGGGQSGTNFGTDPLLKMKNVDGSGDYDRKVFLMFDLKDFKKEGIVTDLKLELAVQFTHGKGVDINLFSVKDTLWNEMGLTFNNASFPDDGPIASLTSSKMDKFKFDVTDFYKSLDHDQRISFMIDAEAGSDETDEFGSKENTALNAPMLIATIGTGNNNLELVTNTGFKVGKGEAFALTNEALKVTGASPSDIIYIIEEVPQHGWLVKGATILRSGDKFTQKDIDVMNLLYINDGTGTNDEIVLYGNDRTGSEIDTFTIPIEID